MHFIYTISRIIIDSNAGEARSALICPGSRLSHRNPMPLLPLPIGRAAKLPTVTVKTGPSNTDKSPIHLRLDD